MSMRPRYGKARNEYCTEKQPDIVAGKIAGQALEVQSSAAGFRMDAKIQLPYFYTGTNRAVVHLAVSDPAGQGMKFQKDQTGIARSD